MPTPTDEELRTAVLDYLKDDYGSLTSTHGYPAQVIASRVIHRHPEFNLEKVRARIIAATTFLAGQGVLNKKSEHGLDRFLLSSNTVNKFSPSQYAQKPISPITINNYGIFINGSNYGNISQNTKEVFEIIDKIVIAINNSTVNSTKKMELIANAETIRSQLLSPNPDEDIIKKSWGILTGAVNLGASIVTLLSLATELAQKLSHIVNLLPSH